LFLFLAARQKKGATGDNCPLRLHLPTAREGEGDGGRSAKQIAFDKNRSMKDGATAAGNIRTNPAMKPLK
jgi:hypothetical protein